MRRAPGAGGKRKKRGGGRAPGRDPAGKGKPPRPPRRALAGEEHEAQHPAHGGPVRGDRRNKREDRKQVPWGRLAEESQQRHAGGHPERDPYGADDGAWKDLEPDQGRIVDRGVEEYLQRLLRLLPPDPDGALYGFEQRERHEEERQQKAGLERGAARESFGDLARHPGQLTEE